MLKCLNSQCNDACFILDMNTVPGRGKNNPATLTPKNLMTLLGFFGVAPAPFCVGSLLSLLAKRKSGWRFASSLLSGLCLSFFLHGSTSFFEAKVFHTFCTLFHRFSHCQDRVLARSAAKREKRGASRLGEACRGHVSDKTYWHKEKVRSRGNKK